VIVYPAIDIRGGRCVRLVEGDFDRETIFDADPAAAARRWTEAGAEWLHVVDLDGAKTGQPVNRDAVLRIREAVSIPIQLGGGLRHLADIAETFSAGIDRAIVGTVALRDPDLVAKAVANWGERVAVALDARDGKLATDGWLGQTGVPAVEAARGLEKAGVCQFIFTDIERDGKLSGPNVESLRAIIAALDASVIASGGMSSLGDIRSVAAVGAKGAIIGRALYDHRIDLREAIATAAGEVLA
jgi:phosphoribosylformimino-5-aminoimidazole carboxamide ribotide isomerase